MHTVEEIRREYKRLDQMIGVDTSHLEIIFSPAGSIPIWMLQISAEEPEDDSV